MSINSVSSVFALCILASCIASRQSHAATPTASFGVTATIQAGCLVSAAPSAYWAYSASGANAASVVSVTCTNATPYIVDMRTGAASGATLPNRRITGPFFALLGYEPASNFQGIVNRSQTLGIDAAGGTPNTSSEAFSVLMQKLVRRYLLGN